MTTSSDCPVATEDVSELMGTAVDRHASSCAFSPGANGEPPHAYFVPQAPDACDRAGATGIERVYGLDVDAYVERHSDTTATVVTCGDLRFQVTADMGEVEVSVAVAETLALFALEGGPGGR